MEFQHAKHHKKTGYPKLHPEGLPLFDYSGIDTITQWCLIHLICVVMLITYDNLGTHMLVDAKGQGCRK